jgi:alpha-L-fucosidase
LRQHSIPARYDEARFGVFVHWSLSPIPAYAPTEKGDIHELTRTEGSMACFRYNPYSDWYLSGLRMGEGPIWEHHRKARGAD